MLAPMPTLVSPRFHNKAEPPALTTQAESGTEWKEDDDGVSISISLASASPQRISYLQELDL